MDKMRRSCHGLKDGLKAGLKVQHGEAREADLDSNKCGGISPAQLADNKSGKFCKTPYWVQ